MLDQRMKANRASRTQFQTDRRNDVSKVRGEVRSLESQADSKANSYKGSFGCVELLGTVIFLFLAMMFSNTRPFAAIAVIIGAFLVVMHPFLKLINATNPASELRSQAARKKQEADTYASQADADVADATKRRDMELEQLKQQRETCQTGIGQMLPVHIAGAGK